MWRAPLVALGLVAACGDNGHHGAELLVVQPAQPLPHTIERGAPISFELGLAAAPDHDVTVTLGSTNAREATVAPSVMMFTTSTWARAQAVTVTPVDDPYVDGAQPYAIEIAATGTLLPIETLSVELVNDDDDVANALATPATGLLTSEAGTAAPFTLVLTAQPLADVTVPIASLTPTEGVTDRDRVTFTPTNWDLPQRVLVTGVDDAIADGVQPYTIALGPATSDDPAWAGLVPPPVQAINVDDDLQAIVVTPTSGLITTEAGGTATFQVVLATRPTADVTIALASTAPGEAQPSTAQLAFTPQTWATPQLVTVTGRDDLVADGDAAWTITLAPAVSADPRYAQLDPDDVTGTNLDDDLPGILATPAAGLVTSERGTTDHFRVTLRSQPTAAVTIAVASSDPTEGSVSPAQLTFTPATWNVAQTVTVRGVDDTLTDGDIAYTIGLAATSADPIYDGLAADPVAVTNLDNDRAGFVIAPTNLVVSEFGDTATFTIALQRRPTANVRITLASSDLTEGFVAPAQLTFTPATWNVARTVTVTGVDDLLTDGNVAFQILTGAATSTDPSYSGLDPADVTVTNIDNETPQVYVKAKPLLTTTEAGGKATYQLRLTTAPTAPVTCPVASSDPTEGIANPAGITFTPTSFGFATITVTGIDDALADGDQLYEVVNAACTSTDPVYAGTDPPDVAAVNVEND